MSLQFCKRCLYADSHPLGLVIDEEGICSGCRIHEEKDQLDWDARWQELERLVAPYRSRSGDTHDCIVPVSGGQDSYWIMHLVKERLGLNPLMVAYNRQYNTPLGIRNLANLRIRYDADFLLQTVNPATVKRVTRTTLRMFGSLHWHILAGQSVWPVQTAARFGIPLIIWGAHQGLEQVGMFSHLHNVEMSRRYRKDHDILGHESRDLPSLFDVLNDEDTAPWLYPDDSTLDSIGVRGIYLGNYVRWDPKAQHEAMIERHDYRTSAFARTFDTYDHVDCFNYMGLHDVSKLYRHGYSKVTDHASREIRHGRLTREEGLALVRRHEQVAPPHVDQFCDWLGMTAEALRFVLDRHRNPQFWTEERPGQWRFHGWSTEGGQAAARAPDIGFQANDRLERDRDARYILIGRGYPD
jgi:N-acetyl sugar amidotransferase